MTPPEPRNVDRLVDLREYLKNVRELWAWAAGAALVPFMANFAELAPPWPPAIVFVTAMFELVALIWAYHSISGVSKAKVTVLLRRCMILLFVATASYLFLLSLLTIKIPGSDIVVVKGFVCTEIAASQFSNCPWLIAEDMKQAEWDAALLWTTLSISISRVVIVLLWIATFFSLSLFLGAFLVRARRDGASS